MTPAEAIDAVRRADLVRCSKDDYRAIRPALQQYAERMVNQAQVVYAQIALMEIHRLDKFFSGQPELATER